MTTIKTKLNNVAMNKELIYDNKTVVLCGWAFNGDLIVRFSINKQTRFKTLPRYTEVECVEDNLKKVETARVGNVNLECEVRYLDTDMWVCGYDMSDYVILQNVFTREMISVDPETLVEAESSDIDFGLY